MDIEPKQAADIKSPAIAGFDETVRHSSALGDRLVAEFRKLAEAHELRTEHLLVNVSEFNDRLMAIEDRLSSLERKPAQSN